MQGNGTLNMRGWPSALLGWGVLLLLMPPAEAATTYYMSPGGSTAATCGSLANPCKLFSVAIPKLNPGDTLVLLDGTYDSTTSG